MVLTAVLDKVPNPSEILDALTGCKGRISVFVQRCLPVLHIADKIVPKGGGRDKNRCEIWDPRQCGASVSGETISFFFPLLAHSGTELVVRSVAM